MKNKVAQVGRGDSTREEEGREVPEFSVQRGPEQLMGELERAGSGSV